MSDKFLKVGDH